MHLKKEGELVIPRRPGARHRSISGLVAMATAFLVGGWAIQSAPGVGTGPSSSKTKANGPSGPAVSSVYTDATSNTSCGTFACNGGVGGLLTITTQAQDLSIGEVGVPYDAELSATGGTGFYRWSLVHGTLPRGLLLSTNGSISGVPTAPGIFNFTVSVGPTGLDGPGYPQTIEADFALQIEAPLGFGVNISTHGGTNGSAIAFAPNFLGSNCFDGPLRALTISGTNQNGETATWNLNGPGSRIGNNAVTFGYWWVGAVSITATIGNRTQTFSAYVPQTYTSQYFSGDTFLGQYLHEGDYYWPQAVLVGCGGTVAYWNATYNVVLPDNNPLWANITGPASDYCAAFYSDQGEGNVDIEISGLTMLDGLGVPWRESINGSIDIPDFLPGTRAITGGYLECVDNPGDNPGSEE